jgi:translation initiation factor 4E
VYDYLIRVNDVKSTTDFHLFKHGIKPTWEDPQNEKGGKWMIRLRKGLASRYWEDIAMAIVGEQFDVGHEICGVVISVRAGEDILSVWNKNSDNLEAKNKIRSTICGMNVEINKLRFVLIYIIYSIIYIHLIGIK